MDAEQFIGLLERRIDGEYGLKPGNLVGALAGFPIRDALEMRAQRGAQSFKDFARTT
jgi:hypothetical protein